MTIRQDNSRENERTTKRDGNRSWIAVAIAVAAIVGGIAAYRMGDSKSTAVQTDSTTTGQNVVPSTTDAIPDRVAPANTQNQASPQGPTGPLNTTSGGAPASNPRGETPPGMQSGPGANN
jgi:hypothetical protein